MNDYDAIAEILGLSKRHVQAAHRGYKSCNAKGTFELIDAVARDLTQAREHTIISLKAKYMNQRTDYAKAKDRREI